MQAVVSWKEKMLFSAHLEGHSVDMDAKSPIGSGTAATPKHLVLAGICGCSGMDVAALMKKYKQDVKTFVIEADAPLTDGHPKIFSKVSLRYLFTGPIEAEKALAAVHLSMTQYCGVSAMIVKASPIEYEVVVNGETVGNGKAQYNI